MSDQQSTDRAHGSTIVYVVGFVLSIIMTLAAYFLVKQQAFAPQALFISVMVLAVTQLFVQLYFFLHLGEEQGPRWKLTTFLFALVVVIIVILGSIWVMTNLGYRHPKHMTPAETNKHIFEEERISR